VWRLSTAGILSQADRPEHYKLFTREWRQTMKTFLRKTIGFWRLLVALVLVTPWILGLGAAPVLADSSTLVPLKGTISGTVAFGSGGFPVFNGTGIFTHMGLVANEGYVVFTNAPVTCPGGVPNDNYETLTAANGDTLSIVSHDVACPVAPNLYYGGGEWEVLGGTGRFSNVSGNGTLTGYSDFNISHFSLQLDGAITLPSGK
jgi:hypothetical protein